MILEPTTIGRYKVLGELGRGAMGVVYLAEDPLLKRGVAIKVVLGGMASQTVALQHFQREAEISARLNHPNVITIFDVGEEPELGPFIAMEFVDGQGLDDLMAEGPLETEHAVLLLIQTLHALEAGHAQGIVHRDLKPSNIMVTKDGRLKLMDFGIAREEGAGQTSDGILCTPSFAAPEILQQQPASPTTDHWALSCMAFKMFLGQLPFEAENMSAILFAIAKGTPVFPENAPQPLVEVFTKALEKAPAARYSNPREFIRELMNALSLSETARNHCLTLLESTAAQGFTSRIPSSLERFFEPRLWLKRPRLWWLLGGAAASLLAYLGFSLWSSVGSKRMDITSIPPGAKAYVDDRSLGKTPLIDAQVPAKAKVIRLEKSGYLPLEHALHPMDRTLSLSLVPTPVTFDVKSDPSGAEVFLNGELMGTSPLKGVPIRPDGMQRLQVRKRGYETVTLNISQEKKPPTPIHLRKTEEKPLWKRFFEN